MTTSKPMPLVEIMYKKRLALNEHWERRSRHCKCEHFFHIACCINNSGNILSFGQNHFLADNIGKKYTIHAEHDAINKLPYTRKRTNIHLLVLRFTKSGKLCSSKPCYGCVQKMNKFCPKKGYRIKKIYYSTNNENIEQTNLFKMTL